MAIIRARQDLEYRDKIFQTWLLHLEGEAEVADFACYYHYLKNRLGLGLSKEVEARLVAKSATGGRGTVSQMEMAAAKAYGLFDYVKATGWAKWQIVYWGRLCCLELFASFGVNSQEFLEALDLHLIRGMDALEGQPDGCATVHQLAIEGHGLERIALETGRSKAHIFACLWHLAA